MRKLTAFLTGVLLLLFCGGCHNAETISQKEITGTETENSVTQDVAIYDDILDIYQKLVALYVSDTFEKDWNNGNVPQWYDVLESTIPDEKEEYGSHLSYMVVTMKGSLNAVTPNSFGYILLDINNDAFPELFWVREDHSILAVFTVANNKVVLLDAFWNRYVCVVTPDNRLYTRGSSGASDTAYEIRRLSSKGKLVPEFVWGTEHIDISPGYHYYEIVDGEKTVIDQTRHNGLFADHPFKLSEAWLAEPITPLKHTNKAIAGQFYDVYELSDSNSEFNQVIRNNPLDNAYQHEIALAGTVGEMCQVEQTYIRLWQNELERATTQFVTTLSDEDREAFTQVQEQFAAYLDASFAYDAELVLHNKYEVQLGEISKWLMYFQQRERIRERAIHIKYLHYLVERASDSTAMEYTSLQFGVPS